MDATSSSRSDAITLVRPPHGVGPAMFALMLATFTIGTGEFAMMGLLPQFAGSLGVSVPRASGTISAYALGVVVGAPLIAVSGAKLARRTLLLLMLVLFVLGNIGSIAMTSLLGVEVLRFITGLPHGAFFGIAALIGASMVERARRGAAVGKVLSGVMFSTVVGAPLSTYAAAHLGWRVAYGAIAALGAVCLIGVWHFAPRDRPEPGVNALSELGAFRRPQVMLTLLTGAIGFSGLFSVYTFLTTDLSRVTHLPDWAVTAYQVIWGVGMVVGNNIGGAMSDRGMSRTILLALGSSGVMLTVYSLLLPSAALMLPVVFLAPITLAALAPALQTRLMEVAGDAQTLAASLNQSAFNIANAVGAWFGALLVDRGFGLGSVGWGGALFSAAGFAIYLLTLWQGRREATA